MFQRTVGADMAWGIPGELALGFPPDVRAEPITLKTAFDNDGTKPTPYGRAVTKADNASLGYAAVQGSAVVAEIGGTGPYIGLLCNPKADVAYAGLASTTVGLEQGANLEVMSECHGMWALLTTSANIGDGVAYAADGQLAAAPKQVAPASHTLIPGARVVRFDVTTGLAMVSLQQLPTPAVAP